MTRPLVLDVSRLVWRRWGGRLPTGIDRVCLAYLAALAGRARLLVQWHDRRVVLGKADSEALAAVLLGGSGQRRRLRLMGRLWLAASRGWLARSRVGGEVRGGFYLNVGHTGLHAPGLPAWLAEWRLRPVYLLHDLIPITHPEYCRPGEAERHRRRVRTMLGDGCGIIVNSTSTGEEIARFARAEGFVLPPVLVAHLGIGEGLFVRGPSPHARPYFLCVGTIEARKNHLLLLDAWDILRREAGEAAPDLVIVGQRGWEAEATFARLDGASEPHGRVIEIAACDDAGLARWIDHARALLMPSRVEGYGLPVLEAMARGTPVIASDLPVFRETAGEIPRYLPADDPAAWARAALDYLGDGPDRSRQLEALAAYAPPRWRAHLRQVEGWLETLPYPTGQ